MTDVLEKQLLERLQFLAKEMEQIDAGTHPKLVHQLNELKAKSDHEKELVEIHYELSKTKIEEDYQRTLERNKEDLEERLKGTKEELLKEIEEQERQIELEYNNTDISRSSTSVPDANTKTLRGRGGVLIEPPTYFNATPRPTIPNITPNTRYLLTDEQIAEDIRAITSACDQISPLKNSKLYDVLLTKQKLTYDGKPFKQGEEVIVENAEYGKFPARLNIVSENVMIFKATLAWDTRQIHASCSDLLEGRVQVAKKRSN